MTHVFPPFEPEQEEKRPRRLVFKRGQVPVRVLIPNIFTLIALCAGLTAIRMAIEGRFDVALAAIIFAAVLDGIDGRVARLLKASSRFGAELDSLADFVNFGVAPAIVIFTWGMTEISSIGWLVVLVFAVCSALRLARFNAALDQPDQPAWKSNYFVGIPAPAGAIVLLLPLYLSELGAPGLWWITTPAVMIYTLAIAFLMVSRIPTFSGKQISQRIRREYVLPVFVLAALFVGVLLTFPFTTLTVGTLVYLAFIPIGYLSYLRAEKRAEALAHAGNGSGAAREGDARQDEGDTDRPSP